MRQELLEFLQAEEAVIASIGWEPYLERIRDLAPSDDERHEMGRMLLSAKDEWSISVIAGAMMMGPHPVFRPYLYKAIELPNMHAKRCCIEALIRWGDIEAVSVLLQRGDIVEAVGDRLPERIEPLAVRGRLSREHEEALVRIAATRLKSVEVLDWYSTPWVDLLCRLKASSLEISRELLRIWGNQRARDYTDKYMILLAMTAHPVPEYESIFRIAAKSKVIDLHDEGVKGLEALQTR